MKKIIKILFFVVLLILIFFGFKNFKLNNYKTEEPKVFEDEKFDKNLILNSEIKVNDSVVKFKNGIANYSEGNFENYLTISDNYFEIDNYVFGEYSFSGGGSGNFIYLVAFEKKGKEIIFVDSVFVGDRIPVKKLQKKLDLKDDTFLLELTFLTRKETDPMTSEPTQEKINYYYFKNGFFAAKENIYINNIKINSTLSNNFEITGFAKGPWYFEASFPVSIYDFQDNLIAQSFATANSDWMTEDFVPFTSNINISNYVGPAIIKLEKDNPSGLPQFDDSLEFNVIIEK